MFMATGFLQSRDWRKQPSLKDAESTMVINRFDDIVEVTLPVLVTYHDASDAGRRLMGLLEDESVCKVMLDLADIGYLHSELLSYLVRFRNVLSSHGGHVRICRLGRQAQEVLNITRLNAVLDVCPTRGTALSELRTCSIPSSV